MPILKVSLPSKPSPEYKVFLGNNVLTKLPTYLKKSKLAHRYAIITDDAVKKIYGRKLLQMLRSEGFEAELFSFQPGEESKNEQTKMKLDHQLLAKKFGRDSLILAFGGGVVGDMAGFVAATYLRGIPYIHIPTTLLAMVDSSIGGKVGVDTPYGKNLIGAFWHPKAIFSDMDFLGKLPETQLVNGFLEATKIFLTYDKKYFDSVWKNFPKIFKKEPLFLQKIITRAAELKIGVITRDEHEANERMVVNFGHTVGHALELLSGYTILHGFAVGLGILVESKIAHLLGILQEEDFENIREAFKTFGVDEADLQKFSAKDIIGATLRDKKSKNGKVRYVLLEKIGKVHVKNGKFGHEVDTKIVEKALQYFNL